MKITWHDQKRERNIQKHGLDFIHAYKVFEGSTFTFEDNRVDYGEQRFVTIGLLDGVVVIVHTESMDEIRIISMRRATKNEQKLYFKNLYGR
ncbi:MAG: BrnT family toxin [Desulfamplus sp.]|nr:BrnT family toxin [Desulfamplus sp.]